MKNTYITKRGRIIQFEKKGKFNYCIMDDGDKVPICTLISEGPIRVKCNKCEKFSEIILYYHLIKRDDYTCFSCVRIGELNPFYGKKHDKEFRKRMSEKRKIQYAGEGNPFYGKHHSGETKDKLREINLGKHDGEKNHFYGKTHSEEARERMSKSQKKYYKDNRETARKRLRENGIKSINKQLKGRKSRPEKLVEEKLKELNIKHKYSKILERTYQYDFLINDNILLEVHGDYWHGNPKFYSKGKDKGKRALNERQKFKIKRDKEKKEFAEKNGYKIFYIWEDDILNDRFDILYKLC